ncbi:MAG: type II CAAX endopeptidase family protein [Methylotenera sp.]|nr:type II CAAX endopeptidase family protein [Methylotenera sp.]
MPTQSFSVAPYKAWLLLTAGPALFLIGIVGVSIFLSVREVPEAQILERVTALVPHILLGVLVCLAVLMTRFAPQVKAAWLLPNPSKAFSDITVGLLVGALLAISYLYWLAPLLETLQRTFGDFVPPGAVLPTVSSSIVLFFIANVLLAPLVEETLYRGIAIPLLTTHLGALWAAVLTCVFFGLLHWAGGLWYMLLAGVVAGGAFAGLFYWRGGVLAPFAAHFALNLIEFIYAWHAQNQA